MKRKLSTGRSRTDLMSRFAYAAPVGGDGQPAPEESDDNTTDKTYEPGPYKPDPDETVVCPSCEKRNDTDAVFCDQCGFQLKGADGVVVQDPPADDTDAHAAAAPAANAPQVPNANPVSDDGSVENGMVCANPDCGHLASAHANGDDGDNTGACSMNACTCEAMTVDSEPNVTDDPGSELAAAGAPDTDAETADTASQDLNAAPPVDGGESMGPAFTIPVLIIEGQKTGDGRQIALDALTWRTPPLPLMGLATETHDPEGFDMNDPAVLCGRIDSLERQPGEGDTQIILARGFYLPNEDGMYFAELNEAMGRIGVSGDVAVQSSEVEVGDVDDMGWPTDMSETLTEGVIMGATVCPYPAFEGAYIVLGDGTEQPDATAIPQQAEQPAVPDAPPAAVVAGGQLIRFVTHEQCAQCDQGLDVIVASGAGPTRPPAAWFTDPAFEPGDGRLVEILDRRGMRAQGGKWACPITVTDDGRVYGHLAPWDVCHIGQPGCVTAPHSAVDYAHFKRGQHVVTAEGDQIRVGTLTCDANHASLSRSTTPTAAMAHYDNTATAVADVNVGEDEFGIWVAGAIRPDATDAQIRKLRASGISGDWRALGGQLELVAALAVPVPGFPHSVINHDAGQVETLVASGAQVMHALKHPPEPEPAGDVALRRALGPLLGQAKDHARDRLAGLRG